ncbi:MAG: hypothetical protein QXT81_00735 [Candidatus Bathyarchaeia archaeon]
MIPLLAAAKRLRLHPGPLFLGWLSWAFAMSTRAVLLSTIWTIFPITSNPDTLPYMMIVTSLDLLEVLSAYLFLTRHPQLKILDPGSRSIFAVGFGVGEAFTLAIATSLPADVAPSLSVVVTLIERLALVAIHFGWVVLVSNYVTTRRTTHLSMAVIFRVFLSTISLTAPLILFFYGLAFELSLLFFGVVLVFYSVVVLSTSSLLSRHVAYSGSHTSAFDSRCFLAGSVSFLGVGLAISTLIQFMHLAFIQSVLTRLLSFMIAAIVLFELFDWAAGEVSSSEVASGAFIGLLIENSIRLASLGEAALKQLTIHSILLHPALNFLAVAAGIALWRSARG